MGQVQVYLAASTATNHFCAHIARQRQCLSLSRRVKGQASPLQTLSDNSACTFWPPTRIVEPLVSITENGIQAPVSLQPNKDRYGQLVLRVPGWIIPEESTSILYRTSTGLYDEEGKAINPAPAGGWRRNLSEASPSFDDPVRPRPSFRHLPL